MVTTAYSDPERLNRFMEDTYHRPVDQPGGIELGGTADDVAMLTELVRWFGSTRSYPGPAAKGPKTP
jgi:hypothetical protein